MATPPTVLELLTFYLPRLADPKTRHAPAWPADLFGLMSALLERSGAYLRALEKWPPRGLKAHLKKLNVPTVALYKDPYTGVREIDLPAGATGVLITLSPQPRTEFSADGRKEDQSDIHPILSGIQFLSANPTKPIMKARKRTKTNANSK